MSFEQEWTSARAESAARQAEHATSMQLNGTGSGPAGLPGGKQDLASTPAEKYAAANTIETELKPGTGTATAWADEESNNAIKAFDGWDTAAGLKKVQKTWDQQVKVLMGRLESEMNNLRVASGYFARTDIGIHSQFTPLAKPRSGLDGV
ncbi:hypothetical protein ACWGI8_06110 [Streptomyces sp. NPDC054841]